ncbi:MAG: hypothetical protein KA116_11630 [Proteobacteria bacterium]|nr:hypothetical protein [Pseudomonadota bacterium]
MDIGNVGRLKATQIVFDRVENEVARQTHSDKDAQGQGYQRPQNTITHLSPEQEEEALKKLNSQSDFAKAGLNAILLREVGKPPYIVVKSMSGEEVRRIPYEHIIRIFLDKKDEGSKGLLFKSSA